VTQKKKHIKWTEEKFINALEEKFPNQYELQSDFLGISKKVKLLHKICDHSWEVLPTNILKSECGCPECKKRKLAETFRMDLESVRKVMKYDEYILLSDEYVNSHVPLKIQCPVGHVFEMNYNNFNSGGQRCPECAIIRNTERQRTPVEEIEKQVKERGFTFISWEDGKYTNTQSKFTLMCSNGHITKKSVGSFQQGCDCPKCVKPSKGEVAITDFLIKNNIKHDSQFEFEDCKYKRPLPFDFVIFNEDGSINYLIEYDGEQHFEPIEIFGGEEKFIQNQRNDSIKNKYCKENNIKLIRIPYWEFNNLNAILTELFLLVHS
jgi:hypothetical protein